MIMSYGAETYEEARQRKDPLPVLRRSRRRRPRRRLRPRRILAIARQRLQERRQGLRHREARAAAARPGRQQQEHDRAAAEARAGTLLAHRRRRALHARLGRSGRRRRRALVPDARGAAAPDSRPLPRRRARASSTPAAAKTTIKVRIVGELCPFCRFIYTERLKKYDGDWTRVVAGRPRQAADPQREGPHRHRHVPAEGREEPGLAPS